jgi:hypothetical protein
MKCYGDWLKVIPTITDTCTSSSETDGSIDCDTSKHVFYAYICMLGLDLLECQYDAGIPVTVSNTVTFCLRVYRQT